VTDVDTLKADPYAFYAKAILKLSRLDPVNAEPSAAWRGTLIHAALQSWGEQDKFRPDRLVSRVTEAFAVENLHPLLTTLWLPRFTEAAAWIAKRTHDDRATGRKPLAVELSGELDIFGVTLRGRLDRIDRLPDGSLVVIDYKTGAPPTAQKVKAGFALQLGLIATMVAGGAFEGVSGSTTVFEYWSLARNLGRYGFAKSPLAKGQSAEDFIAETESHFREAVDTWLIGDAPFLAKRVPNFAHGEYDELMRYEEWFGRHD